MLRIKIAEESLEAWDEAGGTSLYLPSRCAVQAGVRDWMTKHFLL